MDYYPHQGCLLLGGSLLKPLNYKWLDLSPSGLSSATHCPPGQDVINTKGGEFEFIANNSFCHLVVFLWDSQSNVTVPRHMCVIVCLYLRRRCQWLQPAGQVQGCVVAQGWQSSEEWAFPPHRTAAITLNHPPSFILLLSLWPPLASTDLENIWWVQATKSDAGLCFACKQQKYWANYKIIIWC